jgi:hypothetical protein
MGGSGLNTRGIRMIFAKTEKCIFVSTLTATMHSIHSKIDPSVAIFKLHCFLLIEVVHYFGVPEVQKIPPHFSKSCFYLFLGVDYKLIMRLGGPLNLLELQMGLSMRLLMLQSRGLKLTISMVLLLSMPTTWSRSTEQPTGNRFLAHFS